MSIEGSITQGKAIYDSIATSIQEASQAIDCIQKSLANIHQKTEDFEVSCGNAQKEESMLRNIVSEMEKYLSYYEQVAQVSEYFIGNDKIFEDSELVTKYISLQELLDFFNSHIDFMDSETNVLKLTQIKMGLLKQLLTLSISEFKKHKSSLTSSILLEFNIHNTPPSLLETVIYQHNNAIFPLCVIFKFIMNDANKRKDIDCINIMSDIKEMFVGNRFPLAAIYFNAVQSILKNSYIEDFVIIFKHISAVVNKETNYFLQYFRDPCSILQEYKNSLLKLGLDLLVEIINAQQNIDILIESLEIADKQADDLDCCFQHNQSYLQQIKISIKDRIIFLLEIYVTQTFLRGNIASSALDYYTAVATAESNPLLPPIKEALKLIKKMCTVLDKTIISSIVVDIVHKSVSKVKECQASIKYNIRKHLFSAVHYFFLIKEVTLFNLNYSTPQETKRFQPD